MKLTAMLLVAAAAYAQTTKMPTTDVEKIADALRAGPAFITHDAVIADCYQVKNRDCHTDSFPATLLQPWNDSGMTLV